MENYNTTDNMSNYTTGGYPSGYPAGYQYNFYGYEPSLPGAIISAVLYGIFLLVLVILNMRFKSWFMMVVPAAGVLELIGFILRPVAKYDEGRYVTSLVCVYSAPTVYATADYAMISKLMLKAGVYHPIFRPKVVRWLFLAVDIFSFFIQAGGGGLSAAKDQATSKLGAKMLLAGLSVALAVFVFFLFMLIYIVIKMGPKRTSDEFKKPRIIFIILFFDMILLIIRSSYRVAEFADLQYRNAISLNENLFYALDTAMMLTLNVLWIPFHPGFWGILELPDDIGANGKNINVEPGEQLDKLNV